MKKSIIILIIMVVLLGAVIAGLLIFKGIPNSNQNNGSNLGNGGNVDNGSNLSNGGNGDINPDVNSIEITGFAFSPSTLTIQAGDSVTWTNKDSAPHTITSDSGTELNSQQFSNGNSYSHTFNTKGTYAYHCKLHSSMKGNIIVE